MERLQAIQASFRRWRLVEPVEKTVVALPVPGVGNPPPRGIRELGLFAP
jgi:hypothetical protein